MMMNKLCRVVLLWSLAEARMRSNRPSVSLWTVVEEGEEDVDPMFPVSDRPANMTRANMIRVRVDHAVISTVLSETQQANNWPIPLALPGIMDILRGRDEEGENNNNVNFNVGGRNHTNGRETSPPPSVPVDCQFGPSDVVHPQLAAKYPQIISLVGVCEGETRGRATLVYNTEKVASLSLSFHPADDGVANPILTFRVPDSSSSSSSLDGNGYVLMRWKDLDFTPFEWIDSDEPTDADTKVVQQDGDDQGRRDLQDLMYSSFTRYSIAVPTTDEFSTRFTGLASPTKADVHAIVVSIFSQVNALFMREVGVYFQLIADNDDLYCLPGEACADDWINNDRSTALNQVDEYISSILGVEGTGWDSNLNHLLQSQDTGSQFSYSASGLAYTPAVCNTGNGKNGVTMASTREFFGSAFMLDTLTHEIGHQLGAGHTFRHCPPRAADFSANAAVEPGSGTTIMSYEGSCGVTNTDRTDYWFHSKSLEQMRTTVNARSCGTDTDFDANLGQIQPIPETQSTCTVPRGNYVQLNGCISGDSSTAYFFAWDRVDTSAADGDDDYLNPNTPRFIVQQPTTRSSARFLPNMYLLSYDLVEDQLYEIEPKDGGGDTTMTFRFIARSLFDANRLLSIGIFDAGLAGIWGYTDVTLTFSDTTPTLIITSPAPASLTGGTTATFEWVGGIPGDQVQLFIALNTMEDKGLSYAYNEDVEDLAFVAMGETLAVSTGTAIVTIPNLANPNSHDAVIMLRSVESSDCYYFDLLSGTRDANTDMFLGIEYNQAPGPTETIPSQPPSVCSTGTEQPSISPTDAPTQMPSDQPTQSSQPSEVPSLQPSTSQQPSESPTAVPSLSPFDSPTDAPSESPSEVPSRLPSDSPTQSQSETPTAAQSLSPSDVPTLSHQPSDGPTVQPSVSQEPSQTPSQQPSVSLSPSEPPTVSASPSADSARPSDSPTESLQPSTSPTTAPSQAPSESPTQMPTLSGRPSEFPIASPSLSPSDQPTVSSQPSDAPTGSDSPTESLQPSTSPTTAPSQALSESPTQMPTLSGHPSEFPIASPSLPPSNQPTVSSQPSDAPTGKPSTSQEPSSNPTDEPTFAPSDKPTISLQPSAAPTSKPSTSQEPSSNPTDEPTFAPSDKPTISLQPSAAPTSKPSTSQEPSSNPTDEPTFAPLDKPTISLQPSAAPTLLPSSVPTESLVPSVFPSIARVLPTTAPFPTVDICQNPQVLCPLDFGSMSSNFAKSSNSTKLKNSRERGLRNKVSKEPTIRFPVCVAREEGKKGRKKNSQVSIVYETQCITLETYEEIQSAAGLASSVSTNHRGHTRRARKKSSSSTVLDNFTCGCCPSNLEEDIPKFCLGPPLCFDDPVPCSPDDNNNLLLPPTMSSRKGGRNGQSGNNGGRRNGSRYHKSSKSSPKVNHVTICLEGRTLCVDEYEETLLGSTVAYQCGACL